METSDKWKTILAIVVGFLALYLIGHRNYFLYIAFGVSSLTLLVPVTADVIIKGWYKLAELLGWVNSKIILSAVFILFVVPFSYLVKLFRKETMNIGKPTGQSLFHTRNHKYTKEDIQDPW